MKPARLAVTALSAAAHVAVLGLLALHVPSLRSRAPQLPAVADPVMPVLLMPREPRRRKDGEAAPRPIRLHRPARPTAPGEAPMPPLILPRNPGGVPEPVPGAEDSLAMKARDALRSRRDCDDRGLTQVERDACADRTFAGGRGAPRLGLGVDRDKARILEAAVRRNESNYRYKRSLPGPPVPVPPGAGWDEQRSPGPAPSVALGATPHRVPF